MACAAGYVCGNGACVVSCPGNQLDCNRTCVDPTTSRSNCGATAGCGVGGTGSAGTACSAGTVCASGACAVSCPGAEVNCGGTCVNPQTDRAYCGASGDCTGVNDGTACLSGQVCNAGTCAVSCPDNQINCNGTCVDPLTDRTYCGASGGCTGANAGTACAAGRVCAGGTCATSCPGSQVNCSGICVNPQTDRGFCGASGDCTGANDGAVCTSGQVCSLGICQLSCPVNRVECAGNCIDPLTNRAFCGASGDCTGANDGDVCTAGQVCSAGGCQVSCGGTQINCGGNCIQPATDRDFCGASADCQGANHGTNCASGQVCVGGSCQLSCPSNQVKCPNLCIDPNTDPTYCGASGDCDSISGAPGTAGHTCGAGTVCSAGACEASCASPLINCGGACTDPVNDPAHCGATGNCTNTGVGNSAGGTCSAGQVCVAGSCAVSCPSNQVKCGNICIDPTTDPTYCGASGNCTNVGVGNRVGSTCTAGTVCSSGSCAASCASPLINCGGACTDPVNDPAHCGATGNCTNSGVDNSAGGTCSGGQVCVAGSCVVSCPSNQVKCGNICIDPTTDPTYCGATGNCTNVGVGNSDGSTCAAGTVCSSGTCAASCALPLVDCGGACIDPVNDPDHCGASGNCTSSGVGNSPGGICSGGQVCIGGSCAVSCPGNQVKCGSLCIDPNTDPTYCGATGNCTNVGVGNSDGSTCTAGTACSSGMCATSCASPLINCGGACIDPNTNPAHCGANGLCDGTPGNGTGAGCGTLQACVTGSCTDLAVKVVFVTSTVYNGNLVAAEGNGLATGLLAADALCQERAVAGSLGGTFKAWLSAFGTHAATRLTHSAGPYVLQDGTTVVANNWTDLTDGSLAHAINQDESGAVNASGTARSFGSCSGVAGSAVFTNSNGDGTTFSGSDCSAWTNGTAGASGINGDSYAASSSFTLECAAPCNVTSALYCIQQ